MYSWAWNMSQKKGWIFNLSRLFQKKRSERTIYRRAQCDFAAEFDILAFQPAFRVFGPVLLLSCDDSKVKMMIKVIQMVTRSSWLNCALRDDEAVHWVRIGHYEAIAAGNWWDWVSRGHLCLYILKKVEIWTGVTDPWRLTDWLTDRLWKIELLSSL